MPRLLDVALPLPLDRTFSYLPGDRTTEVSPGTRVVVPFRNRREVGIVVGMREEPEGTRQWKAVLSWPDEEPVFSPALLATARWLARHYVASLGLTLRTMLPTLLTASAAPIPRRKERRVAVLARPLESLMERDTLFRRAPRQRDVWELIEAGGGRMPVETIRERTGVGSGVVATMVTRGLLRVEHEGVHRDPFASRAVDGATVHPPTPAQQAAIDILVAAPPGSATLLHGVTGSGKTLVYLEVLRHLLRDPQASAIVLVPEIALTPQTVGRFRAWFGDAVAVLHSALSDGERLDAWRALQRGERRIAVGARSAIFAPLTGVRAIVVDEEHETSYKQGEAPRYHARDIALVRARHEGASVILGSATPSLESWQHALDGRFGLVTLAERVGGGTLPAVEVIDLRPPARRPRVEVADGERIPPPPRETTGTPDPVRRVISEELEGAMRECLARGEQTILLLNRRGYASFLQCPTCGDVVACPNCSISLTWHRAPERLTCHYCAHHAPVPTRCQRCGAGSMRARGHGTQQVERLVGERFPQARVARMDMDTTSAKWAHAEILDRVARGEVDVLLGTQMIAKGLDFPGVTLVGVVDADVAINLPDFRSSERTFQLLAQVAGRAGRGTRPGRVIVQTRLPDNHAITSAAQHDYARFVERELEQRRSPPYPPVTRLANVVVSGTDEAAVAALAQDAAAWIARLVEKRQLEGLRIIGPAPCPIDRIKQRWRWHLLLRTDDAGILSRLLHYLADRFPVPDRHGLRLAIDRDPVSLL